MTKYLLKRILHGLISVVIVVMAIMLLVYNCIDRNKIFNQDPQIQKKSANQRVLYKYQQWEAYGYLDYVPYSDWLSGLVESGELTEEQKNEAASIGTTSKKDSPFVAEYVAKFTEYYKSKGYTIERDDAVYQSGSEVTKYADWLNKRIKDSGFVESVKQSASQLGKTPEEDDVVAAEFASVFTQIYESYGYTVQRSEDNIKITANKITYAEWLDKLVERGELSEEDKASVSSPGNTPEEDSEAAASYISQFTEFFESLGYNVNRNGADITAEVKPVVKYSEWLDGLVQKGKLSESDREEAAQLGETAKKDSASAAKYIKEFTSIYEAGGFRVDRGETDLEAVLPDNYVDWINYYIESGKYKDTFLEKAKEYGQTDEDDSPFAAKYVAEFYESFKGLENYRVERRAANLQANLGTIKYKEWIEQYFEENEEEILQLIDEINATLDSSATKVTISDYKKEASTLGLTPDEDDGAASVFVQKFTEYYEELGYTVERWNWDKELNASVKVVTYSQWLDELVENGELSAEDREEAGKLGRKAEEDNPLAASYIEKFKTTFEEQEYTVSRKDTILRSRQLKLAKGGKQVLFAYKNKPITDRMWNYFKGLISIDNIHYASEVKGTRGLTFTWKDPAYGGEKFSPAIMGNGTKYKYLLYFDDQFPFVHQNLVTIKLGLSYSIKLNYDVWDTMVQPQGRDIKSEIYYPNDFVETAADDMHSLRYKEGSYNEKDPFITRRYVDNYTKTDSSKDGLSKMAYSFIIGVIASVMSYLIGIPVGLLMSRYQNKLIDKIGTMYIIFIIAVPSLAYIFMFRSIGLSMGLPITFNGQVALSFVLPIVSIALKEIGGLMRWSRRYMIDQKNADYVKFARSGGLSESEIFRKHILKNAMVIIVHGIPGTILAALIGAIVTERVYTVPGTGGMLVNAISAYDNSAIVGIAMFYALLSVISLILGDIFMSFVDPRISFTSKGR